MRILSITLNPAIDATYVVVSFERGSAARVIRKHETPGGKGNNVARILAALGHDVMATGFLAGLPGDAIEQGLQRSGIEPRFVRLVEGASRTCHTILESETGVASEILEAGPLVDNQAANDLIELLPALLQGVDAVSLSGSAPSGIDEHFLDRLGGVLRMQADTFVVDSSGEALRTLIEHRPDLIKPNRSEMQDLMGPPADAAEQISFARSTLLPDYLSHNGRVLFSLGESGAFLISMDRVLHAAAPPLRPVNAVGCGDAMLAGFLDGWLSHISDEAALRQAVAFGSAAALRETAGVVAPDDVNRLLRTITVSDRISNEPSINWN